MLKVIHIKPEWLMGFFFTEKEAKFLRNNTFNEIIYLQTTHHLFNLCFTSFFKAQLSKIRIDKNSM